MEPITAYILGVLTMALLAAAYGEDIEWTSRRLIRNLRQWYDTPKLKPDLKPHATPNNSMFSSDYDALHKKLTRENADHGVYSMRSTYSRYLHAINHHDCYADWTHRHTPDPCCADGGATCDHP